MPFETKYSCSDCTHVFSVVTENRPKGRCPSCPECKKKNHATLRSISKSNRSYTQKELDHNTQDILQSRQAPAMGKSDFTKAMDLTANIVMEDCNMTNLRDNLREGENMVPNLAPELEKRVETAFQPQKNNIMGMQGSGLQKTITNQINSGAVKGYSGKDDVVAKMQRNGTGIKTNILYQH